MAAATDPTTRELSAQDVCKVLQPLFPYRRVHATVLSQYKTAGIVVSSGVTFERRPNRCYTFFDAVAVAAVIDLASQGVVLGLVRDIAKAIQGGTISGFVTQESGNLWISYDPEGIAEKVMNHWEAFFEEQGGV